MGTKRKPLLSVTVEQSSATNTARLATRNMPKRERARSPSSDLVNGFRNSMTFGDVPSRKRACSREAKRTPVRPISPNALARPKMVVSKSPRMSLVDGDHADPMSVVIRCGYYTIEVTPPADPKKPPLQWQDSSSSLYSVQAVRSH